MTDKKRQAINFQPVVEKKVEYHKIANSNVEINKNKGIIFQIF